MSRDGKKTYPGLDGFLSVGHRMTKEGQDKQIGLIQDEALKQELRELYADNESYDASWKRRYTFFSEATAAIYKKDCDLRESKAQEAKEVAEKTASEAKKSQQQSAMTDWKSTEAELNSKAIVAPQGLKRSRNVPAEAPKKLNDFESIGVLEDASYFNLDISAVLRLTGGHKDDVRSNEEVAKSALAVSRGDCDKSAGGNVISRLFDRSQNVAIFDSLTSIVQSEKSTAQARKDALEALHNFSAEPDFRSICAEPKNLVTLNNINKMMATKDGGVLEAEVVNQAKNLSAGILSEANEARKAISREDIELDKAVAEARKSEDPNKPVPKEVSNYYAFMTNPERDPLDRGEEYQKVRSEAKRYMDFEKERAKEEQPAPQAEVSEGAKAAGGGGVMQGMSAEDRAAFARASAGLSGVSMAKGPAKVNRAMDGSHAQDAAQNQAKPGARSIG